MKSILFTIVVISGSYHNDLYNYRVKVVDSNDSSIKVNDTITYISTDSMRKARTYKVYFDGSKEIQ